jgi:hypothetical protein
MVSVWQNIVYIWVDTTDTNQMGNPNSGAAGPPWVLWALKYSWPRNVSLADTFPRVEGGDNTILGQDAGSQKGRGRPILVHSQGQS